MISYSNLNQQGVVKSFSDYKRNSARVNVSSQFTDWFKASANVAYVNSFSTRAQGGDNVDGLLLGGLRTSPDFDNSYYQGDYTTVTGAILPDRHVSFRNPLGKNFGPSYSNPLWNIHNNKNTTSVDRIIGNLELAVDPTDWLNITGRAGVDNFTDHNNETFSQKWAAAAKTLKARLYLHLGQYANAVAAAQLGITDPDGDALIPHGTAQTIDNNLNFDFFENSRPGDTGFDDLAYLPVFMKTRLDGVAQAAGKALRNTATDETAVYNHFFKVGVYSTGALDPNTVDGMFVADAPHPLLTFYENQLIIAESQARLGSIAPAIAALNSVRQSLATGYINGQIINASNLAKGIKYDDYAAGDFNPGGLANPVSTGRDQQKGLLYEIISQKYIVSLAQYNVFTDVRRLAKAVPVVQLPIPPTNVRGIPGRYIYPQNEINTNGANVPSPLPDQFTKIPIFQ